MAMAGLIGTGVDTVSGAVTGLQQGIQQHQLAKYNAVTAEHEAISQQNLMEFNAKMEEREAAFAQDEARAAEMRQRMENEHLMGSQRAAAGASGITTAGSPLEVFGETAVNLEMQALDIRRQGEIAQWEHQARAVNYRYQGQSLYNAGMQEGKIARYTGKMALLGGVMKVVSPTIGGDKGGGAGSLISQFSNYRGSASRGSASVPSSYQTKVSGGGGYAGSFGDTGYGNAGRNTA